MMNVDTLFLTVCIILAPRGARLSATPGKINIAKHVEGSDLQFSLPGGLMGSSRSIKRRGMRYDYKKISFKAETY